MQGETRAPWGWAGRRELGSHNWGDWCSHHPAVLLAYPSLPGLLREMQRNSLGFPSRRAPGFTQPTGGAVRLPTFLPSALGAAAVGKPIAPQRARLGVQDCSPGEPRGLPAREQLGSGSGLPLQPGQRRPFASERWKRGKEGERAKRGGAPGGVSGRPPPDACSAAARGREQVSAEPLGLI